MIEMKDPAPAPAASAPAKPTVLLAEDSVVQRTAITALLEKHGYQVAEAADGTEALRHLRLMNQPPAVVLADIGMPRMNGINLCRQIRADPLMRHIPVVMLTVLDDDRNHVTAMEAGADEFLAKPVSERELVVRLELLLASNRARATDELDRYRVIFESLPEAVLLTDENDKVIEANAAASELFGYSRKELLKLESRVLVLHSSRWMENLRARLNDVGVWHGGLPLRQKDGSQIEVDASAKSVVVGRVPVQIWSLRSRRGRVTR